MVEDIITVDTIVTAIITIEATDTEVGTITIMDTDTITEDATEHSLDGMDTIDMLMTTNVMETGLITESTIEAITAIQEAIVDTIEAIIIEITILDHVLHGFRTDQDQVTTVAIRKG